MQYVLVSSCLLGRPVRYDGRAAPSHDAVLARWMAEGRVIAVCPEVAGGLPIPRAPAEIEPGANGARVLHGRARVIENTGQDVSAAFVAGARQACALAQRHAIRVAVLKEGSPSCGSTTIYDGHFRGAKVADMGVTAACLSEAGVRVFSEGQWNAAQAYLTRIEAGQDG